MDGMKFQLLAAHEVHWQDHFVLDLKRLTGRADQTGISTGVMRKPVTLNHRSSVCLAAAPDVRYATWLNWQGSLVIGRALRPPRYSIVLSPSLATTTFNIDSRAPLTYSYTIRARSRRSYITVSFISFLSVVLLQPFAKP